MTSSFSLTKPLLWMTSLLLLSLSPVLSISGQTEQNSGPTKKSDVIPPFKKTVQPTFVKELEKDLHNCHVKSVGFICSKAIEKDFERVVTNSLSNMGLPFVQRKEDMTAKNLNHKGVVQFQRWFRRVYLNFFVNCFVVLVEHPRLLLEAVESAFKADQYGSLAVVPHHTYWMFVTWTHEQWEEVRDQQWYSVLDNVAVIRVKIGKDVPTSTSPHRIKLIDVSTFMWRPNRTREPTEVKWGFREFKDQCVMFPNLYNNMNGRRLRVLTKDYVESIIDVKRAPISNTTSSQLTTGGIMSDILNYSSIYNNFTYDFVQIDNLNSDEYKEVLFNGNADIGLYPWSVLYASTENLTLSYPVLFDEFVGVYRLPCSEPAIDVFMLHSPLLRMCSVMYTGTLLFVSCIYVFIVNFCYKSHSSWEFRRTWVSTQRKESTTRSNDDEGGGWKPCTPLGCVFKCCCTMVIFSMATMNQAYLPRPCQMSSRLIVASWAIGMVLFTAMISSFITADTFSVTHKNPIKTFDQLLAKTDFKFISIDNTVVHDVMNGSNNAILSKLMDKIEFMSSDSKTNYEDGLIHHTMSSLKLNTVFIYHDSVIRSWLKKNNRSLEYYVMNDDPIFKSDMAILFPRDSCLKWSVSESIINMQESGAYDKSLRKWFIPRVDRFSKRKTKIDRHPKFVFHNVVWLVVTCLIFVASSVVLLGVEMCVSRIKTKDCSALISYSFGCLAQRFIVFKPRSFSRGVVSSLRKPRLDVTTD